LSIRVSKRGRCACIAIGAAAAAYALLFSGLTVLALRAEATGHVYPYIGGEGALRLLLASMAGPARGRILLTGASVAGEAFLYEEFGRAFAGHQVRHSSFSAATLNDVLIALDYIERASGAGAIPEMLIVGVDARFLANKPRAFGPNEDRIITDDGFFLINMIDRYSPLFRVEKTNDGSILVAKAPHERLAARWDFWTRKQQPRHRAAIAAALNRIVNGPGQHLDLVTGLPPVEGLRDPFARPVAMTAIRYISAAGPYTAFRSWLPAYISPYDAHYGLRAAPNLDPDYGWGFRLWNPSSEAGLLTSQVSRLRATAARLNMKLVIVNVPQRPASRSAHPQVYYDAMMALVLAALGDTPFLDLRTLLNDEDFIDEHVSRTGAQRVTAEVIAFIRSQQLI
jgi:hypothetical protein